MQEHKIDDLLGSYSESLGHFAGTVPMPRRKPVRLWKPILVVCTGISAIAGLLLLPKKAEAASIETIEKALSSAKYWHSVAWQFDSSKNIWLSNYSETYLKGVFICESNAGKPYSSSNLVESGFVYSDLTRLPYIFRTKLDQVKFFELHQNPATHPFQYYKKAKFVRQDGLDFKGTRAYSLSLAGKKGGTVFQAILETETNLPLIILMKTGGTKGQFNYKIEYNYDKPANLVTLGPNPSKPIIVIPEALDKLERLWGSVKPDIQGPSIYSSTISPNGTIWIASKVPKNDLNAVSLSDSNYGSETCYVLKNFTNEFSFVSRFPEVQVHEFIPIYDMPSLPKAVIVRFGHSSRRTINVSCNLGAEKWNFPDYFAPIILDPNTELMKGSYWSFRANARRKKGDLKGAIDAYLENYQVQRENHYRVFTFNNPLKAAAECYEKLGEKAKANELRKLIPKGEHAQYR